jgi:hypothetical protein
MGLMMPPRVCPRCNHTNPEIAVFCYYDGAELVSLHGGAPVYGRLGREFVFPAGRHCSTFDELARGCQDEWPTARDLLRKGTFKQFFASTGRMDLARAAEEAMGNADADIGLTAFLSSLPVTPGQGPRLDLHPRRLVLGNLLAGETRDLQVTISNRGKGLLQGTLSVVDGGKWLRLAAGNDGTQCALRTAGDQHIALRVDTRGLAAAKSYGAKVRVVTNGGIVEVPAGMKLMPQQFQRAPLQGVRTPRDMAVKMRSQPKAAVPLLESGEVARWFNVNGWDYPVHGPHAHGVAGVQQFFECMGLSRPPPVRVSDAEVRVSCKYPTPARGQVSIQTAAKKWVYARVETDVPWIRVLNPDVAGPRQAPVSFAVDPRLVPGLRSAKGKLLVTANAGQILTVHVRADVRGAPGPPGGRLLQPALVMALVLLVFRLVVTPLVEIEGGGAAMARAVVDGPRDLGEQVVSTFVRSLALSTWWMGALAGVLLLWRRGGGVVDVPFGLVAGAAAGLVGGATLACLVVAGDLLPSWFWSLLGGGAGYWILWFPLVLLCWTVLGAAVGVFLGLLGPAGRAVLGPLQTALGGLCWLCRLRRAAAYFNTP